MMNKMKIVLLTISLALAFYNANKFSRSNSTVTNAIQTIPNQTWDGGYGGEKSFNFVIGNGGVFSRIIYPCYLFPNRFDPPINDQYASGLTIEIPYDLPTSENEYFKNFLFHVQGFEYYIPYRFFKGNPIAAIIEKEGVRKLQANITNDDSKTDTFEIRFLIHEGAARLMPKQEMERFISILDARRKADIIATNAKIQNSKAAIANNLINLQNIMNDLESNLNVLKSAYPAKASLVSAVRELIQSKVDAKNLDMKSIKKSLEKFEPLI